MKKGRKAFWRNFKFKYKLTIINENTLEEVVGIHVSKLNGLSVLLSFCSVIFLVAAFIIIYTPLRNYLPGYMNSETREMVVTNALRVDSLKLALDKQNRYIMSIQDIFSGNVKVDSVQSIDSLTNLRSEQLMERSVEEEKFRKKYEENERYNLRNVADKASASGLLFYRPVNGIVEDAFSPDNGMNGVRLSSGVSENVLAVLDGTVISAQYTAGQGYVIMVQHVQNFISIYKNCGVLMRKAGDRVKGGDVIAVMRGVEELARDEADKKKQDHSYLTFELWHRGSPVDPEKFVVF